MDFSVMDSKIHNLPDIVFPAELDQPRQPASLHRQQGVGLHQRGQDSHPVDLEH